MQVLFVDAYAGRDQETMHATGVKYFASEGESVADGLPQEANAIGDSGQKRQRWKHAHHEQQLPRAQFPGGRFPAKIWMPTNQIRAISAQHTYPATYVRVHLRHLGVYKES